MKKGKPLGRVLSAKQFVSKMGKRGRRFFALGNFLLEKKDLSQNYYSNLGNEANILETFLDNHKARGNRATDIKVMSWRKMKNFSMIFKVFLSFAIPVFLISIRL